MNFGSKRRAITITGSSSGCAIACAATALAQVPLYSNQSVDPSQPALATGAVAGSGAAAPVGGQWSESPAVGADANAIAGFSSSSLGVPGAGAYRFAEDFVVPNTVAGWELDRVAFFAYQTGWASGGASPFSGLSVRVWSGRPGEQASTLLWGDPLTNRLVSSQPTNLYRIFNSTATPLPQSPDSTRRIWRTEGSIGDGGGIPGTGLVLAPGTYWLDWQYTCADSNALAFSPPVTALGTRAPAGASSNALQLTGAGIGTWIDLLDSGKPEWAADVKQELPFILIGSVAVPCPADFDGVNGRTADDIFAFLSAWFAQVTFTGPGYTADVNNDEIVSSDDIFAFLELWFAGC